MILVWMLIIIAVMIVALFLALRSMRDYQDVPKNKSDSGLFLVGNKANLTPEVIFKVNELAKFYDSPVSFEKLYKGTESVLIIYGLTKLVREFPELALLELEDYLAESEPDLALPKDLKKIAVKNCISWVISGSGSKHELQLKSRFINMVRLDDDQHFSLQIITSVNTNRTTSLQATMRVIVADQDPNQRIKLVKQINQLVLEQTNLIPQTREQTTTEVFDSFKKRALIPKEVMELVLTPGQVFNLLSL